MEVAKTGFVEKTSLAVTTAVRNTSCSRGWLRLVVQMLFGLITVASFILIVVMAMQNNSQSIVPPVENRRCLATSCRVVCSNAPFYGEFISDIIDAMMEIELDCPKGIKLTLNRPMFTNSIIPKNWLSEITSKVIELAIVAGNLRQIEADAFMSPFARNIMYLILEEVDIYNIGPDSLVGLSSLHIFELRSSQIHHIERNALRAVDDTLMVLLIRNTGSFNPTNFTGTSELKVLIRVDFSSNEFGSLLGRESFRQLEECEELNLSSSRITAIGLGTFDFMVNVKKIYLNNNLLVTLPAGIFDRITTLSNDPAPLIDLQDNSWRCDCLIDHLRIMQAEGFLMVDPTCSSPYQLNGMLFSNFDTFCCIGYECYRNKLNCSTSCYRKRNRNHNVNRLLSDDSSSSAYINGSCTTHRHRNDDCTFNSAQWSNKSLLNIYKQIILNSHIRDAVTPTFYIESSGVSLLELKYPTRNKSSSYELVWYQSDCVTDIFCLNSLPDYLHIYNVNIHSTYIFCLIEKNATLSVNNCTAYSPIFSPSHKNYPSLIFIRVGIYMATATMSMIIGAACLYTVIRRNPTLLRGSKRILLVKHKAVDALVLPPRVPIRDNCSINKSDNITTVTPQWNKNNSRKFTRTHSIGSGTSNCPSYISAIQPTEAQLTEWRLRQRFKDNLTIDQNGSLVSYIYDTDSIYYTVDSLENININEDIMTFEK